MLLLDVDHISYHVRRRRLFREGGSLHAILHGVTFQLAAGESLAIVGLSGSGKTTLARCIAGLLEPTEGRILLEGASVRPDSGPSRVQLLFQNHSASLDPMQTVRESLTEGLEASQSSRDAEACAALLDSVDLGTGLLERRPAQLSGGERQRVALARALAAQPRILVADEPTSALDRLTAESLLSLLNRLREQRRFTLLHVTHDLASAQRTCTNAVVMEQGAIVDRGSWEQIRLSPHHSSTEALFAAAGRSGTFIGTSASHSAKDQ